MRKISIQTICASVVLCIMSSCGASDDSSSNATIGKYPPLKICRFYEDVYECSEKGSCELLLSDSVLSRGVSAVSIMLNVGHPEDSVFVKYVNSDAVKMFTPKVKEVYNDLGELENLLGGVSENLKKELPTLKMCDIYAIISPNRQKSIYVTDSVTMLLSLNHYLGSDHEAYKGFPEYVKQVKTPKHIPYDVVEAMIGTSSLQFEPDGSETVLKMILYQGALTEAKMRLIPGASLAMALGYTDEQLKWLEDNEQKAWESIVSQELLYSTTPSDIEKLLAPSPATTIINANAPGRAGRYFGYKIIKSYLQKNPEKTLSQLLSPDFYGDKQSFITSSYQGK